MNLFKRAAKIIPVDFCGAVASTGEFDHSGEEALLPGGDDGRDADDDKDTRSFVRGSGAIGLFPADDTGASCGDFAVGFRFFSQEFSQSLESGEILFKGSGGEEFAVDVEFPEAFCGGGIAQSFGDDQGRARGEQRFERGDTEPSDDRDLLTASFFVR